MFAEQAERMREEQNHLQQQQIKKPVMGTVLKLDTSGTFSGTIGLFFEGSEKSLLAYLEGYASLHESQELKLKRQNDGKEHSSSQMGSEEGRKGGGKDRGRGRRKREEELGRGRRKKGGKREEEGR